MLGEGQRLLGRVDDSLGALLECRLELRLLVVSLSSDCCETSYERNDLRRLGHELVRKFFVIRNKVRNINVAEILLDEHILAYLVPG